jgi:toxin-antitoxin system PIN domain toxin
VPLPDVNALVYAFRREHPRCAEYREWLERLTSGPEAYGMSDIGLAEFVRVVTRPRVYQHPDSVEAALEFADQLRARAGCVLVMPGPRHGGIFGDLCRQTSARGSFIWDAYLAALAIESGCEWITTDRDFARFPGLRWSHPLQ